MSTQGKKITDTFWNKKYLEVLENSIGITTVACKQAGVSPQSYYSYRRIHKEFAEKVDEIIDGAILPAIEDAILSRALKGDTKLLLFILRNRCKGKWNQDKYQEIKQKQIADRNIDKEYYEKLDEEQKVPSMAERMAANTYYEILTEYEDAEKDNKEDDDEEDD